MPVPLRNIPQKHSTGCAIAAIAIVARVSYEKVFRLTSKFHKNNVYNLGLSSDEIMYTLRHLGMRARVHDDWDHHKPAILIFDWSPGNNNTESHSMVWDPSFGGRFLDPSGKGYDVDWKFNLSLWHKSGKETVEVK